MKFNEDTTELTKLMIRTNAVPLLIGDAGIGKSSLIEDIAKQMGTKLFVVPCNLLADKGDLTAPKLITDNNNVTSQQFFPHHQISEAIRYAEENPDLLVILALEEINRADSDIASGALDMITARRLGNKVFPDNLRLIATGNDKGNVIALDDAATSRFVVMHVEPDAQNFLELLGHKLHPAVIAVLRRRPDLIFQRSDSSETLMTDGHDDDDDDQYASIAALNQTGEEMLQLTTPRTIEKASDFLVELGDEKISEFMQTETEITTFTGNTRETTMLNEVLESYLGNTEFVTQLVSELASMIQQGTSTTPANVPVKPAVYTHLKAQTTVDELETAIEQLSNDDKVNTLVYAIYDKQDNAAMITLIAGYDDLQLSRDQATAVMNHIGDAEQINTQAIEKLASDAATQGTNITQTLNALVGLHG